MLSERDSMSRAVIAIKSEIIQERFMVLSEFKHSKILASYYSFGSEVRTFRIMDEALDKNRVVALPKINKNYMEFYQIDVNSVFYTNKFGIPEPTPLSSQKVSDELDLVLVPGIAFDTYGYRIGYGYGYYDRFLADKGNSIVCVGLAFDSQVVQQVPHVSHDRKLDILLTDKRIFYF